MRIYTHNKNKARPINILSLNVVKGSTNHEIALNEAHLSLIDIILIQDLYISNDRSRRITKKHPNYEVFSPIDDWTSIRPRVITYVRKNLGIRAEQVRPNLSGDLLHLRLVLHDGHPLNIYNNYNPPSSNEANNPLELLYDSTMDSFNGSCLLKGDFNLHHPLWQPSWRNSTSPAAEKFVNWVEENNFNLLSPLGIPTLNRGNELDLVCGLGPLLSNTRSKIAHNLVCPSDHLPLFTLVSC